MLEPAKNLSLKTQKNNLSIIDAIDAVEETNIIVTVKKAWWRGRIYIHCFSNI